MKIIQIKVRLLPLIYTIILFLQHGPCFSQNHSHSSLQKTGSGAHLKIKFTNEFKGDTVWLFVHGKMITSESPKPQGDPDIKTVIDKHGIADFYLPMIHKISYISLLKDLSKDTARTKHLPVLDKYLIEPGDDVTMDVKLDTAYHPEKHMINLEGRGLVNELVFFDTRKYQKKYAFFFSGPGSSKFQARANIDKMLYITDDALLWDQNGALVPSLKIKKGMEILNGFKSGIAPFAYKVLEADLIGNVEQIRVRSTWSSSVTPAMLKAAGTVPINTFPAEVMALSAYYPDFLVDLYHYVKYPLDKMVLGTGAYYPLKSDYKAGELRDRLLYQFIYKENVWLSEEVTEDALKTIKTPFYLNALTSSANALTKGKVAFDFNLPDMKGDSIKLNNFKGKVVFMDFWYTGCENCTYYYKHGLSQTEEKFRDNPDVVFISVSIDSDWKKWLRSVNSGLYTGLEAKNVVNLYTDGKSSHHPIINHYQVTGYPRPVLIDKHGKIISTKDVELRAHGEKGLTDMISEALKQK